MPGPDAAGRRSASRRSASRRSASRPRSRRRWTPSSTGCGVAGTPPTPSAGRCATRCWAARPPIGTSRPTRQPPEIGELFPVAVYENRFGTVAIRRKRRGVRDHDLPGRPRLCRPPSAPSGRVRVDLARTSARRDFTINALAWGGPAIPPPAAGGSRPSELADPFHGLDDLARRRLRSVGEAPQRFHEDALRMIRAASASLLPSTSRSTPPTLEAIRLQARHAEHLSGEGAWRHLVRTDPGGADPVARAPPAPADPGLLAVVLPELEAQVGVPQNKVPEARTSGTTRCVRSMTPGPSGLSSGSLHCCTTSASRRPSPMVTSTVTTRSVPPGSRRISSNASTYPGQRPIVRSPRPSWPATCSPTS